jgi:acetolactate synthase regulatory subunit
MQTETKAVVVEFKNNLYEMERILSSVRRRNFELVELQVTAADNSGRLSARLTLNNIAGGSRSFEALRLQLNKHIDVEAVKIV